ncbi:transposase [Xylocopilactobacillus apis]|uniref:transposase n=1 Tax=Xylocopilactobacillus apis TaxID=2932183 RepID=UPI003CE53A4A
MKGYHKLGNEMDQTIETMKKHLREVLNSCRYPDSNGPLEGLNGKIKKIKRTSYGFRSWENFRLRVYLECGMQKTVLE